jgi:hypothetical protein
MRVSDETSYSDSKGSVVRMKFVMHMKLQRLQLQLSAHEIQRALGVAESQARRVRQLQFEDYPVGYCGMGIYKVLPSKLTSSTVNLSGATARG